MSETGIAFVIFTIVFGSALLGLFVRDALPEHFPARVPPESRGAA